MATERLELPDGQWADIRTSPNHAQYRAVIAAMEDAGTGRATMIEWASTVGRQMTAAWLVRDEQGKTLELDDEGWDAAPADIVDAICTEAQLIWKEWQAKRRPLAMSRRSRSDPESRSGTSDVSSDAS